MTHEVPEGWETSSFGSRCRVQSGYAFKSADFVDEGANTVPVIRMSNLKSGTITLEDSKYVDVAKVWGLENFRLSQGDFLFGMSGSIGNYGVVTKQADGSYLNQRVGRLMVQDGFPQFFQYLYLSQRFQNILKGKAAGNAQVNISSKDIQAIEVTIPSLPEQKKIAEVLCSVDEAIAATKAVIDQTKQVKKGLLQTLLTKGIGHTKFKQTELGEVPEGWGILSLDDITPPDRKITYGIVQAGPHVDDGVPYIRVSDMNETGLSLKGMMRTSPDIAAKYKRSEVKGGDIVYALRGKIGHVLPVPDFLSGANLTQGTARIAPGQSVTSRYLFWVMAAPRTVQLALREVKGSTFKEITLKKLKSLLITVPPIEEQNQIAEKLDGIETALNVSLEKLAQLQVLKSGLMSDLLSGRKRVEV